MTPVVLILLAQLPSSYMYVDPVKLGALVLALAIWALFAQWVDKDALAVNTYRVLWNVIVLGVGVAAALVGLLVPMFAAGYSIMWAINLIVMIMYVVHRNGLVKEDDKVFTLGHFRRLREQGFGGKKKSVEVSEKVRLTASNRRVVEIPTEDDEREKYRLAQDLLFNAFIRRAAIVEVAPAGPQAARATYIIDGVAAEGESLSRPDGEALIGYLKHLAGLALEERRKPQKGAIMAAVGANKHKVIVRTDGSTAGEKLSVRIIDREADFKVPDLGLLPRQLEVAQATKDVGKGLILLSAPPGNGLTTSIYSFTRNHDRFLQNVQTIEYEKELDLDNVTQNLISPTETATFSDRLLKLVRSDPDIIVLPEVRERVAAVVASKAAAEKQKVYAALQASDVVEALRKWLTMVGDRNLVAKSLLAVSNQRLVRVLCSTCKQAYKPDPQMMRKLNLPEDKILYRPPEQVFDKRGAPILCQACQGTGYIGRTAIFDWLTVDAALREVIRKSTTMSEIQTFLVKRGGLGLQAHAFQKVLDGVTSIQEVARVMRGEGVTPVRPQQRLTAGRTVPRPRPGPGSQPATGSSQ
jgi:type II secretory ATPase GspE/PulE/Tfp pilus assembly ATPase PilB-like protein